MITKPDLVAKTAPGRRFDRLASSLIGFLAVLAAMLAIVQAGQSQAGGRATSMAARLAGDILTRSSVSRLVDDFAGGTQLQAIDLRVDAFARQGQGLSRDDTGAVAVGEADERAAELLQAAMTETIGTSGGTPLDPYTAALVKASLDELQAEVVEQGRQVDIATAAGGRGRLAILGLSLTALAGVLVGLALVLREGRPGWTALIAACGIASLAVAAGVAAVV